MTTWPIKSLHQIELSSQCNLRCVYCPSQTLQRPKIDMDEATFLRSLEWVKHYRMAGTQGELNLAGTGESTLHPRLVEYAALARKALGTTQRLLFTTNGLLITEELADALMPTGIKVFVSLHRPEKAGPAINILRDRGMFIGASADPSLSSVDWAGQVEWETTTEAFGSQCDWRKQGWVMVLSDGRMTTCCFDADGSGVIGNVNDEIGSVVGKPYRLCKTCHMDVGFEGWRDRVEGRVKK